MCGTQEKEPLQVRINVDGHPHVMHIQFGADVHAGVAEFAAKMGLSEDSKQALTKQVREPDPDPTLTLTNAVGSSRERELESQPYSSASSLLHVLSDNLTTRRPCKQQIFLHSTPLTQLPVSCLSSRERQHIGERLFR